MQQPEISCTDTKLKSKQKSFRLSEAYDLLPYVYVWWCNGWMFVSSLSWRFPFFSAVFMFAVSSSHHFPLCTAMWDKNVHQYDTHTKINNNVCV